jgi:ATP-dependent DNA helicase RecQ
VVLLRGREDRRIQDFFIEQAFPPKDRVDRVLEALDGDGATTNELMGAVNLGKSRIEAMLKVLDVEGAVTREGTKWLRVPGADWRYDGDRYAHVTQLRRHEQAAMAAFGADGRCLMRALREELDDPDPQDCGVCAVCTQPKFDGPLDPALVRDAALSLRSKPLVLDVKKMAPDAEGKMRKLGDDVKAEEGRALARLGDGGWDPLVQSGRREGRFDDELVAAAAELVRTWRPPTASPGGLITASLGWVTAVPSARTGPLVPDFAQRLAHALQLPFHPVLERVRENPPQREMTNSVQQVANVRGAFAVVNATPQSACLLVDDVRVSGWTLAMLAGQLRRKGSGPVFPLALASAF